MTLPHLPALTTVTEAPQWVLVTAATVTATVCFLVVHAWFSRRGRHPLQVPAQSAGTVKTAVQRTVATAGPLALLGVCGLAVSLYGLYGFATETMALPVVFALPFMMIFDVAEIVSFVSLYRSAAVETKWTSAMRRTRRMAWMLVAASSAMNAAHAPGNWIATCAFAIVPPVSAKLIEFELDKQLAANSDEDEDEAAAGFVRLVQLAYAHLWGAIFARLGFDATSRDGRIQREASIRRAAQQLYRLGRALDAQDKAEEGKPRRQRRAEKRVDRWKARAQLAIDVAGIAGDTAGQLVLARHLAARGRVVDLARMDVRNPLSIMTTLEELAIVPSAEAIEAGARAAQAKRERQEAEDARDAARAAQAEAEKEANRVREEAAAELTAAKTTREEAEATAAALIEQAEEAAEAAEAAEGRRAEAQEAYDQLTAQIEELEKRGRALDDSVQGRAEQYQEAAAELADLHEQAERAAAALNERAQEAEKAQKARDEALDARRAALEDVEKAREAFEGLEKRARSLHKEAEAHEARRRQYGPELERLEKLHQEAAKRAQEAQDEAEKLRAEAQRAEGERKAAGVALRHAREAIMDALTSPEPYEPPRWTSEYKRRGWELYLHKVHTDGVEPTDAELAGEDRDPSTARRWRTDFRAELARLTASSLPAPQDAHDRTADQAPALV